MEAVTEDRHAELCVGTVGLCVVGAGLVCGVGLERLQCVGEGAEAEGDGKERYLVAALWET